MALERCGEVLAELEKTLSAIDEGAARHFEELLLGAGEVFCCGLGRSGLAVRGFAMRLMHMGRACSIVGDTLAHPIHTDDVLLMVSASGGSLSLRAAAEKARSIGAKVTLVTANPTCPLAERADVLVKIAAPSKEDEGLAHRSISPMGSLFEEAAGLFLDLVTLDMMEALHVSGKDMVARHANLE